MRIAFVEISNFRKLRAVRVELTSTTTLFVGANNSGKTSAMTAMRHFLVDRGRVNPHDFTLSLWSKINAVGRQWHAADPASHTVLTALAEWYGHIPCLKVLLDVTNDEIHYDSKIITTLEWSIILLGTRVSNEPTNMEELHKTYLIAINEKHK